jgi:hypothetical protein
MLNKVGMLYKINKRLFVNLTNLLKSHWMYYTLELYWGCTYFTVQPYLWILDQYMGYQSTQ